MNPSQLDLLDEAQREANQIFLSSCSLYELRRVIMAIVDNPEKANQILPCHISLLNAAIGAQVGRFAAEVVTVLGKLPDEALMANLRAKQKKFYQELGDGTDGRKAFLNLLEIVSALEFIELTMKNTEDV